MIISWTSRRATTTTNLLDNRQYPWLTVIIAIGANTQVNFLFVSISLVCGRELENAVRTQSMLKT